MGNRNNIPKTSPVQNDIENKAEEEPVNFSVKSEMPSDPLQLSIMQQNSNTLNANKPKTKKRKKGDRKYKGEARNTKTPKIKVAAQNSTSVFPKEAKKNDEAQLLSQPSPQPQPNSHRKPHTKPQSRPQARQHRQHGQPQPQSPSQPKSQSPSQPQLQPQPQPPSQPRSPTYSRHESQSPPPFPSRIPSQDKTQSKKKLSKTHSHNNETMDSYQQADIQRERPENYNKDLMKENPLGLQEQDGNFRCILWGIESYKTLRDFIEVNSIPMYELNNGENFHNYCIEKGWFNTANKFNSMCKSLTNTNSRMVHSVRNKFNVTLGISDCFPQSNGLLVRAYQIKGSSRHIVEGAFYYLRLSWNKHHSMYARTDHDELFSCRDYVELCEMMPPRREKLFEETPECCERNNMNKLKINGLERSITNYYNFDNQISHNNDYFLLSLPSELVDIQNQMIHKYNCQSRLLQRASDPKLMKKVLLIKGNNLDVDKLKNEICQKMKRDVNASSRLIEL